MERFFIRKVINLNVRMKIANLSQEGGCMMKKKTKYLVVCSIFVLLMIASIVFATLIGSGEIELSHTLKYVFICVAVICGILSSVALRRARKINEDK